jgi:DNA-binding transcriptional MerR regulator
VTDRSYLSIGEVLSLLRPEFPDLTISKIRFLESQGLLNPERTPSGYRKFYEGDVDRLRWVLRQQREQYLPLKVIKGRLGSDAGDDAETETATGRVATAAPPEPEPERERVPERSPQPAAGPLDGGASGVSLTLEELAAAAGLRVEQVQDLERFGLFTGRMVGGSAYYDEDSLVIARLAAGFLRFGVEGRHLRMYKTAAEREASFFEQLVMPLLKQRNPTARQQAIETLQELGRLGQGLRNAMLRQALRDHTGA